MFNDLLLGLQNRVKAYDRQNPSVLGNLLSKKAWNQDIRRFGGVIDSPISNPMFKGRFAPQKPIIKRQMINYRKPAPVKMLKKAPPKRLIPEARAQVPSPTPGYSIEDLISRTFPEDPNTARAVFQHESQLGKYFQNMQGAPAYGVAQIYLPAHRANIPGNSDPEKIEWLRNPENNLKMARRIYDDARRRGDGWQPWESYTTGKYKQYLK